MLSGKFEFFRSDIPAFNALEVYISAFSLDMTKSLYSSRTHGDDEFNPILEKVEDRNYTIQIVALLM
jgi:hypothetical protein